MSMQDIVISAWCENHARSSTALLQVPQRDMQNKGDDMFKKYEATLGNVEGIAYVTFCDGRYELRFVAQIGGREEMFRYCGTDFVTLVVAVEAAVSYIVDDPLEMMFRSMGK